MGTWKKSQHAYDCYCTHFGKTDNHVNKNISEIDKALIPDHNLLVGGFPCQDYSVARTGATGINGKREFYGGISEIFLKKIS